MALKAEGLDLNRVAVFLQIAEARGVSAAAARANLPKSSVSRALAQLEDELGVELVVRHVKPFQLTEAGQLFYTAAAKGIAAVSDARERLRKDTELPRGKIKVAAPPGFASFVVMPVVIAFLDRYPEVEIELTVSAAQLELLRDGFDVVFAIGALDDSTAKVRRIGASDAGIFASATYLDRHGPPKKPGDLSKHACILHSRARKKTQWRLSGPGGSVEVSVRGRLVIDDLFSAMTAAISGAGLVVLPIHMVARDPGARSLRRVLPDWIIRGEPTQLLYPASRHVPSRVSMFVDAIVEHTRGSCLAHA